MLLPFRLYYKTGCPHCKEVIDRLTEANIPVQLIEIGDDEIIQNGVLKLLGVLQIPILLYFPTKKIVVGNQKAIIDELVAHFLGLVSPSGISNTASQGQSVPETAEQVGAV
jgi:glutaredoxin